MSYRMPTLVQRSLFPSDDVSIQEEGGGATGASPVTGRRDAEAAGAETDGPSREEVVVGRGGVATHSAEFATEEQTPIVDEEKDGIMGATICFTPAQSPASSHRGSSRRDAFASFASNRQHCNSHGDDVNSIATSHCSYEILRVTSFKGTDEAGYLRLAEVDDGAERAAVEEGKEVAAGEEEKAAKNKESLRQADDDRASALSSLSTPSTLPSLRVTPFKLLQPEESGVPQAVLSQAEREESKPPQVESTAAPSLKDNKSPNASPENEEGINKTAASSEDSNGHVVGGNMSNPSSKEDSVGQTEEEESKGFHVVAEVQHGKAFMKAVLDKATTSVTAGCEKAVSGLKALKLFIVDKAAASVAADRKKALSGPKAFNIGRSLCGLICVALAVKTSLKDTKENPADLQNTGEHNFQCFSTHSTSFASIPLWEFEVGIFEEELLDGQLPINQVSSYWPYLLLMLSTAALLFSASASSTATTKSTAAATTSTTTMSSTAAANASAAVATNSPTAAHGMWSEEEHKQFIEGHRQYGDNWDLVSQFVPSRTTIQVKRHANSWMKIGSPMKMKKARKATPVKKTPETPKIVSSIQKTPKRSNRATVVPRKGILIEQTGNQLHKHVTPRSEKRSNRML